MTKTILFRSWSGNLVQGLLLILLSIVIFSNPNTVITAMAFWFGLTIVIGGAFGLVSWFKTSSSDRNIYSIVGSIVMIFIGLLMILKIAVTIKAITLVFGILVTTLGFEILSGGFRHRSNWSLWWVIALSGILTLIIGIKSLFDIYSGARTIGNIIGLAFLFSGIGLLGFAYIKRNIITTVKSKVKNNLL